MIYNGRFDNPKVVLYCQVGKALDMLDFSLNQAINNAGLPQKEFDIVMLCWKTSEEVYQYLKEKNLKYVEMEYDSARDFLWNLYKGWNLGYEIGYKYAEFVCPIATDHAFYKNWLKNLMKHAKKNRIVNCKLIEPGTLPSVHSTRNLGLTLPNSFMQVEFNQLAKALSKNTLITNDRAYGHRLDAMPFVCPKDVWKRFGPMEQILLDEGLTGDTDFFDRCKKGKVEITKALDAISYHCGGVETRRNQGLKHKTKDILRKLKKAILTNDI